MSSFYSVAPDQLTQVRHNTDWRDLFDALQIAKDSKKSKDHEWWGKSPFCPDEATASFRMNARGWYCHATGQGGGPIELVQGVHAGMNCYQAGRWLLDRGLSRVVADARGEIADATAPDEPPQRVNPPIRQDLRSQLNPTHPAFVQRGIPDRVLCDLGAGYLDRPPRKNGLPDPMNHRLVFQIRGVGRVGDRLGSFIVGHIGRATTAEQEEHDGKWWTYPGFRKSLELFHQDLVLLDERAREQAATTGHVLVVEGCFDVAKLRAAGIFNVVATFGAGLSEVQLERLRSLAAELSVDRVRFFYDRDEAGEKATRTAIEMISGSTGNLAAEAFDWSQTWTSGKREQVPIPDSIADPADFSPGQLRWLRQEGLL